jgi:hypothetical protein
VPKFHKLSFPLYDGKEDPLGWLNRCESFFRGQLTREVDKVWLASFHMTGDAQQWYYLLERDAGRPTWDNFRLLCHQRFGPALSTNHLADLARLPFTSTVNAYMSAFQAWLAHAGRLEPLQQAQLFTGGLPEHIRVDVELHEPADLHRAMRLARAFERLNAGKVPALPAAPPRSSRRTSSGQLGSSSAMSATSGQPSSRPFRYLTPTEMAERRKQGLCYNCDEPYVQGHKCARLFYLEAADYIVEEPPSDSEDAEPDTDNTPAQPSISLSAIAGISTATTMQVYVQVGGEQCIALLDSGSTHNFISGEVARRAASVSDHALVQVSRLQTVTGWTAVELPMTWAFASRTRRSPWTATRSHLTDGTWSSASRSYGLWARYCGILMTYAWPSHVAGIAYFGGALVR